MKIGVKGKYVSFSPHPTTNSSKFGVFKSPKKPPKFHSEINWPLSKVKFRNLNSHFQIDFWDLAFYIQTRTGVIIYLN